MNKGTVSILSMLTGAVIGTGVTEKNKGKKLIEIQKMSNKHLVLFLMMNQWVKIKQEGKNLSSYFEERGYRNIAIYGMSYAGQTLVEELKDTTVNITYGIDKDADFIYTDFEVVSIDDDLRSVDAVVVTAISFFGEIKEKLEKRVDCPIISLEDVLYEMQ